MRSLSLSLALGLGLALMGAARAEESSPALKAYLTNPARVKEMGESARRAIPFVAGTCKDIVPAGKTRLTVVKPLTFNDQGHPTAGTFREIVPVTFCGEAVDVNIWALARPDGTVKRIAMLPGQSRAEPQLQLDAMRQVMMAAVFQARSAGVDLSGCKAFNVRNTRITKDVTDGTWTEIWDTEQCGTRAPIEIEFATAADGTNFRVSIPKPAKPEAGAAAKR